MAFEAGNGGMCNGWSTVLVKGKGVARFSSAADSPWGNDIRGSVDFVLFKSFETR